MADQFHVTFVWPLVSDVVGIFFRQAWTASRMLKKRGLIAQCFRGVHCFTPKSDKLAPRSPPTTKKALAYTSRYLEQINISTTKPPRPLRPLHPRIHHRHRKHSTLAPRPHPHRPILSQVHRHPETRLTLHRRLRSLRMGQRLRIRRREYAASAPKL